MPNTPLGIPTPADSIRISQLAESARESFAVVDDLLQGGMTPEMTDIARQIAQQEAVTAVSEELDNQGLVSAMQIDMDRVEWVSEDQGEVLLAVEDPQGSPYFAGSPTVITQPIKENAIELVDENGVMFAAFDNIDGILKQRLDDGVQQTHFILLAGQSNSYGIGAPIVAGTNERLHNLYTIPQRGAAVGREVRASDPIYHPYNNPVANSIGHGFSFARKYALANPGVKVVVIGLAKSGSGFWSPSDPNYSWAPTRVGESGVTNLYENAIQRANDAINGYTGITRVAAILWHQGEGDAVGNTTEANYIAQLDLLIDGFRSRITGASAAPFIIGQLGWEFRNVRQPGTWAQIDAAHQATPNRKAGTAFAPAPPQGHMQSDNTHFTAYGQKQLAQSMTDAFQAAQYNIKETA